MNAKHVTPKQDKANLCSSNSNNNSSQVLESDIDLQIKSYDEKIQIIKQEHVNELYILQNQHLNDVQMRKLQV